MICLLFGFLQKDDDSCSDGVDIRGSLWRPTRQAVEACVSIPTESLILVGGMIACHVSQFIKSEYCVQVLNLALWVWLACAALVLLWQFSEKLIDVRPATCSSPWSDSTVFHYIERCSKLCIWRLDGDYLQIRANMLLSQAASHRRNSDLNSNWSAIDSR